MANTKLDQSRILNASAIGKQVLSASDAAAVRTLLGIPADIPFVTAPKAYTPTLTGFGSLSLVKARSWRVGNILYGIVDATTGAAAGTEARVSLGYDGIDGNVHIDSQWNSFRFIAGSMILTTALAADIRMLGIGGDNFLRIGVQNSGNAGLTPINANALGSAFAFSATYAVEIEEW